VRCPYCGSSSTRVADSCVSDLGDAIRRRRECAACERRFTTYERAEADRVTVRKRSGRREPFDRQKLLRGLLRAANKRPLSEEQLDAVADEIAHRVRSAGPEVDARAIGDLALRKLAELDPVTAILFASVYRNFRDLEELEDELHRIRSEPHSGPMAKPLPSDPRATLADPPADPPAAAIASKSGKG
jgi:transcriptional repressor NrdR